MMTRTSYRGQPLVALIFTLGGWIAMRTVMWDAAASSPDSLAGFSSVAGEAVGSDAKAPRHKVNLSHAVPDTPADPRHRGVSPQRTAMPQGPRAVGYRPADGPRAPVWQVAPPPSASVRSSTGAGVQATAAHQLMWMAAVSHIPIPVAALLPRRPAAPAPFYPVGRDPSTRTRHWSADAWLLLRDGGNMALAGTASPASYGASQAGAVIRYRLAPASDHRPAAYLRATSALGEIRDREAALGLSARPLPRVPVVVAAEVRFSDQGHRTAARPALLAVTEIAPITLPAGLRAEAYGQAGYVGGRYATAFADGQLRADRAVARLGTSDLRAGAGAWGGAQKGAARLDIGPTASLGLTPGGTAAARVAVDWRFRVAGNAAPSSGPALTLSAGF